MRIRRAVLSFGLLVLAVSGCTAPLGASQPAPKLEPGQRVRLKVPSASPPRQIGTLVAVAGDSIVLRAAGADPAGNDTVRLAFPIAAVSMAERSLGVHNNALQGAVYGGQAGLIAVLVGFAAGHWVPGDAESNAVFLGSMAGGAVIGATVRTEHWRRVALGSLRTGVVPLPAGRLGIGVTFSLQR